MPLAQTDAVRIVAKDIPWMQVVRRKPRVKTIVGKRVTTTSLLGGSGVVDLVVSGIRRTSQATEELNAYLQDNVSI